MLKVVVLLALTACVHAQGDLDSLIQSIFNQGQTNQPAAPTAAPPKVEDRAPSTIVPPASKGNVTDFSCSTPEGKSGECVNYYLCNASNNTIITDGTGLIDIRFQGACASYMDVCCIPPDQRPPTDPITPKPDPIKESRKGCGWANPEGVGFKTTGERDSETKFGEFPWMVAILKTMPVNADDPDTQKLNVYVGGGSLISRSAVLTAAHYVYERPELRVRVGEWDTQNTKEIYPYQEREVESIAVHQDFNSGNLFYDVAILFLKTPVDLAPNVGLVCLPAIKEMPQPGTRCTATGWGKDKFGKEGRYQVILKEVTVPVVDRRVCENKLRGTRLGSYFILHTSFMCAGGEPGKDTCKGDGGSPLVCPVEFEKDRYVQNGIVAWGIGCGDNGLPGVYVDVANVRAWIDERIDEKGLDSTDYLLYNYEKKV